MPRNTKTVVFPGRFQPFHNGHASVLLDLLKQFDRVVVALGSSDLHDLDNPFTFSERKKMIRAFLSQEKIPKKRILFVSLPFAVDSKWVSVLLGNVPRKTFDTVYSNNPRVRRQLKKRNIAVISSRLLNRKTVQGKRIRRFKSGWEKNVPSPVARWIKNNRSASRAKRFIS